MASRLQSFAGMMKPLLLALLVVSALPLHAQELEPRDGTRVIAAQVTGIETSKLSAELREAIDKLAGTSLDRARLRELAARLELEQPRYVTAIRTTADPSGGARVVFVVARVRDEARDADVNARYVVQDARIEGAAEARIPDELRAAVQALVGKSLDSDEADRIETKLREALPGYDVVRKSVRGSQPGRITLIFDVQRGESSRRLRYEPLDFSAVYHSKQGWGGTFPLTLAGGNLMINPIIALSNADDLIEEYSGFALRVESRKIGTDRFGAFFEWSTASEKWRDATLATLGADRSIPAAYKHRSTVTPLVKFAITPQLTIAGGVSATELKPLDGALPPTSRSVNAGVGFLRFHQRWAADKKPHHDLDAALTMRAGARTLGSDLTYMRYLFEGGYQYEKGPQRLFVGALGGRVTGDAPLFERFALGDTKTLRGWDKFALTPVGGNRMRHVSLEYSYHSVGMFLDAGSAWTAGSPARNRFAAGLNVTPGPLFFTLGFPLNGDNVRPIFAMGFRWSSSPASVKKH